MSRGVCSEKWEFRPPPVAIPAGEIHLLKWTYSLPVDHHPLYKAADVSTG